jgi:putative endonuclease
MRPNVQQYYVYMLTNRWKNVLYTGVTNSLEKRVWQHKSGALPGFTRKYNCKFLVHYETYDRIEQAIAREKEIKGWTRAKKDALIAISNPGWDDLSADWYGSEPNDGGTTSSPRVDEQRPDAGGPSPSSRLRMTES